VLDYDHTRGEKGFNIMHAVKRQMNISLSAIAEEIEKCDLVCRNCHALRTWEREQAKEGSDTMFARLQARGVL
jgi:hypothetical protein